MLSTKPIPCEERLIFALDVDSPEQARGLVESLGDAVHFYKLGLQLFMAGGYFDLLEWLIGKGKRVMVDLKFFDVPQTVGAAVGQLTKYGVSFATVHGNDAMLRAACEAKDGLGILAVTALTSLDQGDLEALGFHCDVQALVLSRARRALALGCDGLVSSGLEAGALRGQLGEQFLIVTPGIRPVANVDDQKRTVSLEDAFSSGADYVVVGRPIRDTPDPRGAALAIQHIIASLFQR